MTASLASAVAFDPFADEEHDQQKYSRTRTKRQSTKTRGGGERRRSHANRPQKERLSDDFSSEHTSTTVLTEGSGSATSSILSPAWKLREKAKLSLKSPRIKMEIGGRTTSDEMSLDDHFSLNSSAHGKSRQRSDASVSSHRSSTSRIVEQRRKRPVTVSMDSDEPPSVPSMFHYGLSPRKAIRKPDRETSPDRLCMDMKTSRWAASEPCLNHNHESDAEDANGSTHSHRRHRDSSRADYNDSQTLCSSAHASSTRRVRTKSSYRDDLDGSSHSSRSTSRHSTMSPHRQRRERRESRQHHDLVDSDHAASAPSPGRRRAYARSDLDSSPHSVGSRRSITSDRKSSRKARWGKMPYLDIDRKEDNLESGNAHSSRNDSRDTSRPASPNRGSRRSSSARNLTCDTAIVSSSKKTKSRSMDDQCTSRMQTRPGLGQKSSSLRRYGRVSSRKSIWKPMDSSEDDCRGLSSPRRQVHSHSKNSIQDDSARKPLSAWELREFSKNHGMESPQKTMKANATRGPLTPLRVHFELADDELPPAFRQLSSPRKSSEARPASPNSLPPPKRDTRRMSSKEKKRRALIRLNQRSNVLVSLDAFAGDSAYYR